MEYIYRKGDGFQKYFSRIILTLARQREEMIDRNNFHRNKYEKFVESMFFKNSLCI